LEEGYMHIPDGYLGPLTYGTMYAATVSFWAIASWKMNRTLKAKQAPYLAIGAAFSFVIMMFNIPVAILIGPWAATIAVSVALIIQALLFGDGGITAIGANCFNMAIAGVFVGYGVYWLVSLGSAIGSRRRLIAGGVAAYVSLNISALLTAIQFGIQPIIERSSSGQPLYAPFPLNIAIPAMAIEHLFLFGFVEAAVTALVIRYFQKNEPEMLG